MFLSSVSFYGKEILNSVKSSNPWVFGLEKRTMEDPLTCEYAGKGLNKRG